MPQRQQQFQVLNHKMNYDFFFGLANFFAYLAKI